MVENCSELKLQGCIQNYLEEKDHTESYQISSEKTLVPLYKGIISLLKIFFNIAAADNRLFLKCSVSAKICDGGGQVSVRDLQTVLHGSNRCPGLEYDCNDKPHDVSAMKICTKHLVLSLPAGIAKLQCFLQFK